MNSSVHGHADLRNSAAQVLNGLLVAFGCPYRRRSHRQSSRPASRTARTAPAASTASTTTSRLGRSTSAAQAAPAAYAAPSPLLRCSPPGPAVPGTAPAAQSTSAAQSASAVPATPMAAATRTPPRHRNPPRPTVPAAIPADARPQLISAPPASPTPAFSQPDGHGRTSPARPTSRRVDAAGARAQADGTAPKARRSLHGSQRPSAAARPSASVALPGTATATATKQRHDPRVSADHLYARYVQAQLDEEAAAAFAAEAAALASKPTPATVAMGSADVLGLNGEVIKRPSAFFKLGECKFAVRYSKLGQRKVRAVYSQTISSRVPRSAVAPRAIRPTPSDAEVADLLDFLQVGVPVVEVLRNKKRLEEVEAAAAKYYSSLCNMSA